MTNQIVISEKALEKLIKHVNGDYWITKDDAFMIIMDTITALNSEPLITKRRQC